MLAIYTNERNLNFEDRTGIGLQISAPRLKFCSLNFVRIVGNIKNKFLPHKNTPLHHYKILPFHVTVGNVEADETLHTLKGFNTGTVEWKNTAFRGQAVYIGTSVILSACTKSWIPIGFFEFQISEF